MIAFLTSTHCLPDLAIEQAEDVFEAHGDRLAENILRFEDVQTTSCAIDGVDVNYIAPENQRPRLFVADMDSTMIGQETIDEIADFVGRKAEVAAITEAAMRGELAFEDALRERVAILAGLDAAVLDRVYAERLIANEGAVDLLAALGRAGTRRVLVSGGFTFAADALGRDLGFDRVVANVLAVEDGKLTGTVEGSIVGRETKAAVLHNEATTLGIAAPQIAAIGDGANDIDMIEAAGTGIAFYAKPALASRAQIALNHSHLDALIAILDL